MQQRVSIITLGVADVPAATSFYERWAGRAGLEVEETVFFQIGDLPPHRSGVHDPDRLTASARRDAR